MTIWVSGKVSQKSKKGGGWYMHVFMSSKNQTQHCTKNLKTAVKFEATSSSVCGGFAACRPR